MDYYCKSCKHVRTAGEIGLPREPAGSWGAPPLYCGRQMPPVTSNGHVAGLPPGDGLKNMSCWEAEHDDRSGVQFGLGRDDVDALVNLLDRAKTRGEADTFAHPGEVLTLGILAERLARVHDWMHAGKRKKVRS